MIDIDALSNVSVDAPLSTVIPVCPEGEYTAVIKSLPDGGVKEWLRTVTTKRGDTVQLRVPFSILDDQVKAQLDRQEVTVNKDIWLDLGPDNRTLLTTEGKNVDLGRLREALGQNNMPGWTFGSLAGCGPVKVLVKQRSDKDDPTRKFASVIRVSKL